MNVEENAADKTVEGRGLVELPSGLELPRLPIPVVLAVKTMEEAVDRRGVVLEVLESVEQYD